jgi:hypothetical protein
MLCGLVDGRSCRISQKKKVALLTKHGALQTYNDRKKELERLARERGIPSRHQVEHLPREKRPRTAGQVACEEVDHEWLPQLVKWRDLEKPAPRKRAARRSFRYVPDDFAGKTCTKKEAVDWVMENFDRRGVETADMPGPLALRFWNTALEMGSAGSKWLAEMAVKLEKKDEPDAPEEDRGNEYDLGELIRDCRRGIESEAKTTC